MLDFEFTNHARDMLAERNISEDWIWRVLNEPDTKSTGVDGNLHYARPIDEKDGRMLHVVVDPNVKPNRIVTLFFDRRLRRQK